MVEEQERVVKVARDGTVTVDGAVRGTVQKTTEGTSIYSAIGGYPGPAKWYALDRDGNRLIDTWCNTRREATVIVVKCTDPLRVEPFERDRYTTKTRWVTFVRVKGATIGVSRTVGSGQWIVHYIVERGAFCPRYSTLPGTGAYKVTDLDVLAALDQAAADAGITFAA